MILHSTHFDTKPFLYGIFMIIISLCLSSCGADDSNSDTSNVKVEPISDVGTPPPTITEPPINDEVEEPKTSVSKDNNHTTSTKNDFNAEKNNREDQKKTEKNTESKTKKNTPTIERRKENLAIVKKDTYTENWSSKKKASNPSTSNKNEEGKKEVEKPYSIKEVPSKEIEVVDSPSEKQKPVSKPSKEKSLSDVTSPFNYTKESLAEDLKTFSKSENKALEAKLKASFANDSKVTVRGREYSFRGYLLHLGLTGYHLIKVEDLKTNSKGRIAEITLIETSLKN